MSLQRISEFAENQEGSAIFITLRRGALPGLHPEVFAQIDSTDGIGLNNLIRHTFGQNAAFAYDVSMVTDTKGFTNVMVGNEYPNLAVPQEAHNTLNFPNSNRVNSSKGFI